MIRIRMAMAMVATIVLPLPGIRMQRGRRVQQNALGLKGSDDFISFILNLRCVTCDVHSWLGTWGLFSIHYPVFSIQYSYNIIKMQDFKGEMRAMLELLQNVRLLLIPKRRVQSTNKIVQCTNMN